MKVKSLSKVKIVIIALAAVAFCACVFPIIIKATNVGNFELDAYGTWLQGVLTPIAVIIAALTFFEQTRDQREANRINLKSHFITSIPAFQSHLNYLCASAIRCDYVDRHSVKTNLGDVSDVKEFLSRCEAANLRDRELVMVLGKKYREIRKSEQYQVLKQDISDITKLAKESGYSSLLDTRITEIDRLMYEIDKSSLSA